MSDIYSRDAQQHARPWFKKKRWWVVGAIVALFAIGSLPGGEEDLSKSASRSDTSESSEPADKAPEPETGESEAEAEQESRPDEAKPEESEPEETRAQENARLQAESYLEFSPFSRSGLIEQLEFEGFSKKDSTYGVDALNVNWRKQAAIAAEEYLDSSPFSRAGLIDQLVFEGFTPGQATYGVNKTGL